MAFWRVAKGPSPPGCGPPPEVNSRTCQGGTGDDRNGQGKDARRYSSHREDRKRYRARGADEMIGVTYLLFAALLGIVVLILFALWKKDSVRAKLRLRTFDFVLEAKNDRHDSRD